MRSGVTRDCVEKCTSLNLPVVSIISPEQVARLDISLGISDFVVIPANPNELVTRVKRVLRQTVSVEDNETMRIGGLVINPTTYEVALNGKRVNLRFKEYELLRFLMGNQGRVWSRQQLLSKVWGYEYYGGARTVDVHIRRLRAKLGEERASWITTVRSVGYRFG